MPKLLDLTDRVIGRLTVLGPAPRGADGPAWRTRCTCGTEGTYPSKTLLAVGGRRSCGCAMRMELEGRTFGMLRVLGLAARIPRQQGARWTCQCRCGRTVPVRAKDLLNGNTTSCGCRINRLVVSRGELTPRQLASLEAVGRAPDGLSTRDLLPILGINRGNVARNLRKLVDRGYVVRRFKGPRNSRVFILPAGLDVLYGTQPGRRRAA